MDEHICFYFAIGSKEVLLLGSAQCFKNIYDGAIKVAPSKQKRVVTTPMNEH
jgi:hypothetical protein